MTNTALNYDSLATKSGICREPEEGCMDNTMSNYNKFATYQSTTVCVAFIMGCTEAGALNYDSLATTEDGTCIDAMAGCMDSLAANYDVVYNVDDADNPCFYYVEGCTAPSAQNFDSLATINTQNACIFDSAENGRRGCTDSLYKEYLPLATIKSGCNTLYIYGCTQQGAANYDSTATVYDASCVPAPLAGCLLTDDTNYNPTVDVNDASMCAGVTMGCIDSLSLCYNPAAQEDDGSCYNAGCVGTYGCTDSLASNYNPLATKERLAGTCAMPPSTGCSRTDATNYDPSAIGCDMSNPSCCTGFIRGCTDSRFVNYDAIADNDDNSCYKVGCTIKYAINYDPLATDPTGIAAQNPDVCTLPTVGCMDSAAPNYAPLAQYEGPDAPGWPQCQYPGCLDSSAPNFNPTANVVSSGALGGCDVVIGGCTNSDAPNYLPGANLDTGSCELSGCMIPGAVNYKAWAQTPTLCDMLSVGCTDSAGANYRPEFTRSAAPMNSCPASILGDNPKSFCNRACAILGCTDSSYYSYDPSATTFELSSCKVKIPGCTDPRSNFNFQTTANYDDGTCLYGGCTDSIRHKYDPTSNLQLYDPGNDTVTYEDDTWTWCGGWEVPPSAPPPDLRIQFVLTFQTMETCNSMFPVIGCDYKYYLMSKFADFMRSRGSYTWTMTDMISAEIPSCSYDECRRKLSGEIAEGRQLTGVDAEGRQLSEAIAIDLETYLPPGMTTEEFIEQLMAVNSSEWTDAFGIAITGLLLCQRLADGTLVCYAPPPSVASPPPPPVAVPSETPVLVIVLSVVLGTTFIVLLVLGGVYYRRKQKRIDTSAVTPETAERAVVQPPALPAQPPAGSVSTSNE
jgi:hypothetical protein